MQVALCPKCKGVNVKTLSEMVKRFFPHASLVYGCQSFCGPGRWQPFVMVNHKCITAPTEAALFEKLRALAEKESREYDRGETTESQTLSGPNS